MKMLKLPSVLKTLLASIVMVAASASATTILPGSETSLQQIICGLYTASGTPCSHAADVNKEQYGSHDVWQFGGSGAAQASFLVQVAGLTNETSFGIYEAYSASAPGTPFDSAASLATGMGISSGGSARRNSADTDVNVAGNALGSYLTAGNNTLFSRMSLNGGYDAMVAFRGDNDSIMIGHYASGPWSKNQFLLGWNDGRGTGGDGEILPPIAHPTSGLPEPSTLALLGLGLLGFGVLKRRQAKN